MDDLGKSRQQNIAKFKKALPDDDTATIEAALDLIASLNPYPAYGFASAEPTAYVQPDVWVREDKQGWTVGSNEAAWPQVQLNREYCDMLEEAGGVDKVWQEKIII